MLKYCLRTIFCTDISSKILIREDSNKDCFLISTPADTDNVI